MLKLTLSILLLLSIYCQDAEVIPSEDTEMTLNETELSLEEEDIEVIPVADPNNITIAFGSCLNTFEGSEEIEKALQPIIDTQPNLWMWLGDVVYLDGDTFFTGTLPGAGYDISDAEFVENVFNTLKDHPTYVELRENMPVVGTWDDHDYAYDNTDKNYPYKDRNKNIFLDFFDVPAESPRRDRQGVYSSFYVGEDKLIKVILLDIRYNKEPQVIFGAIRDTDTNADFDDMLGEEQWEWLNTQLQDQTPTYTLIATGTQFIPDDRFILEYWYAQSRERIFDLIVSNQKSGVVFLSGDVHYAEILTYPCPERVGYKGLFELTTSGLTHSAAPADIVDGIFPDTYSREEDRFFGQNFALLKFIQQEDNTQPPNLLFEARDLDNNVVLTKEISYDDLVFDEALATNYSGCALIDGDTDTDSD